MSFSGGGLRAATLAASVLDQLNDDKLADKIAVISSTSGGSVAAGYFAAKGMEGMEEFRDQFLYNDNTSDLKRLLLPSLLTGTNRSHQFANYLDDRLFQSKPLTYGDLIAQWNKDKTPFVVLNSSDMSSGRTFEFTQESFSNLCSDLAVFRLSEAMAASAAFPFLMSPIPLRNHWDKLECPDKAGFDHKYDIAAGERYINLASFVKAQYNHALRYTYTYGDDRAKQPSRRIQYVHLIDGGLADNLAARALLHIFDVDVVNLLRKKGVKSILLVQVNAKSDDVRKIDLSGDIPSWIEVFKTVALNPIDVATTLSSYISSAYWVSLIRSVNAEAGKASHQPGNVLRLFPVQVDFDLMTDDREKQRQVKNIATDWSLSKEDVALVQEAGKTLLKEHPCYKVFKWEVTFPPEGERPSSVCDKVDVSLREPKVGETAPAPAPAPAPIVEPEKLSLSADTLFDFNKADLRSEGKQALDELVSNLEGVKYDFVVVIGYADRLEDEKLSVRRAEAVKSYLVEKKGIPADKVFTDGKGNANPVTGDSCRGQEKTKALIECLAPDRRVEVEIAGTRETVE